MKEKRDNHYLTMKQVHWAHRKWCEGHTKVDIAAALKCTVRGLEKVFERFELKREKIPLVYDEAEYTGWIPVTERLPEKGVLVLVSDGSDYPEAAELVLRKSGRLIWEDGNFREVEHITHWMPLPEPPEEVN